MSYFIKFVAVLVLLWDSVKENPRVWALMAIAVAVTVSLIYECGYSCGLVDGRLGS